MICNIIKQDGAPVNRQIDLRGRVWYIFRKGVGIYAKHGTQN